MYRPYVIFNSLAAILFALGLIPFLRYLFFFLVDRTPGSHLQSLILGSVLVISAFIVLAIGIIADLTRINRTLTEEMLEQIKHERFDK